MKRCMWTFAVIPAVMIATAHAAPAASAIRAEVAQAVHQDTLPSLRNVPIDPAGYDHWRQHAEHRIPLPYTPPGQTDGALQNFEQPIGQFAPTFISGVDGVGNGFSGPNGTFTVQYAPPDTVGAVGATQYVQVVNTGFAVFNKATKSVVYGPVPTSTLWSGFGGQCQTDNDGDAVVVYDKVANRWIISQFAVGTTRRISQCVAVSQTSDATGRLVPLLAFRTAACFPTIRKMGVWPDAYYETFTLFTRKLVQRRQALRLQPQRDADRRGRDAAVLPAVVEFRRRAAVRSRRLDRTAGGLAELHGQFRDEPVEPLEIPRRLDDTREHDADGTDESRGRGVHAGLRRQQLRAAERHDEPESSIRSGIG